jgi:hypothetical protein
MIKRHQDQLWARLDDLYANGTTFISFQEIYHWYNIQRIAKAPWRDMKAKWESLLEDKGERYSDPKVAYLEGGVSLFFAKKPETLSKLAE